MATVILSDTRALSAYGQKYGIITFGGSASAGAWKSRLGSYVRTGKAGGEISGCAKEKSISGTAVPVWGRHRGAAAPRAESVRLSRECLISASTRRGGDFRLRRSEHGRRRSCTADAGSSLHLFCDPETGRYLRSRHLQALWESAECCPYPNE